jgi:chaperonin cofactor prefoldin
LLEKGAKIYKLIGPALIKQDLPEVRANVEKRLDFINTELYNLLFAQEC